MVQAWFNSDKLYRKFGPDNSVSTAVGGEYKTYGTQHLIEVSIPLTSLTTSDAIMNDQIFFPKNVRIEKVEVVTTTAATSGGSATLSVGLLQSADRTTAIASAGFVSALAVATIAAVGTITALTVGSTSVGTLVGTTNATVGNISAKYTTAAFTAGVVKVRIYFTA